MQSKEQNPTLSKITDKYKEYSTPVNVNRESCLLVPPEIDNPSLYIFNELMGDNLVCAESRFKEYEWYQNIPQLKEIRTKVTKKDPTEELTQKNVKEIELEINIDGNTTSIPSPIAIIENGTDTLFNLEDCIILTNPNYPKFDPEKLTELLIQSFFIPSDEINSGSYEDQESRFRARAIEKSYSTLKNPLTGVKERIQYIIQETIAWTIHPSIEVSIKIKGNQVEVKATHS